MNVTGVSVAVGGAGTAAEDEPDALPRRARAAQQATRSGDAGAPGNGCPAVATGCRSGQATDTPARGDELGAAALFNRSCAARENYRLATGEFGHAFGKFIALDVFRQNVRGAATSADMIPQSVKNEVEDLYVRAAEKRRLRIAQSPS